MNDDLVKSLALIINTSFKANNITSANQRAAVIADVTERVFIDFFVGRNDSAPTKKVSALLGVVR